jgi:hypothetical protein
VDKAKSLIGYEPRKDFKIGLMNTIDWLKKNWEKIERSASFSSGISWAVRNKDS